MNSRHAIPITWLPVVGGLAATLLGRLTIGAALIPGLYPTGVDDQGRLLPAATVDPHYSLISSADPAYPGPAVYTLSPGYPVPPWLPEGPYSRWIAPRPEQAIGNAQGSYIYRISFDLTGYDPTKAFIQGRWAVDNGGVDVVLNGVSLGIANTAGFVQWSDFTINQGFVAGVNTLDFIVSNAPETPNPTGLRVEMLGTVEVEGEPPSIVLPPTDQRVVAGESVTFTVVAIGESPLFYQWRFEGVDLPGENRPTLTLTAVATNQAGRYDVVVENFNGVIISPPAILTVLTPLPGLFNTGVDDSGAALPDYALDPHYRLVVNPDSPSADAVVQDSTVFPIVSGPWVANRPDSKWIGPRGETSGAAGGDYVYRLVLDLIGLDPTTAFVSGYWTSDNAGSLFLNGAPTGLSAPGNFGELNSFILPTALFRAPTLWIFTSTMLPPATPVCACKTCVGAPCPPSQPICRRGSWLSRWTRQ